jgi:hypothetical protein
VAQSEAPRRDQGLIRRVPATKRRRVETRQQRRRRIRRRLLTGRQPEPEPAYIGLLEDPASPRVGICCSGGGVRSAAYNLGALQALDRRGVLKQAEYLAAVSGGSYIAAAFAMVDDTREDGSDPELVTPERGAFYRGSPEEQYLRNRASYLAPGGMGKLFLLQRVLAGLAFNLFFIGLALLMLGMLLSGLFYVRWYHGLTHTTDEAFTIPFVCRWLPAVIVIPGVVLALLSVLVEFRHDDRRAAVETWCARLLLAGAGVALFTIVLPWLVWLVHQQGVDPGTGNAGSRLVGTGTVGLVTVVTGVLLQLRARLADPVSVLEQLKPLQRRLRSLGKGTRMAIVYFAGAVAGPALLLAFLVAVVSAALTASSTGHPDPTIWLVLAASTVLFSFFYSIADITSWSLHPFYKRRLCTAFALKRVAGEGPAAEAGQAVERSYDTQVPLSRTGFCAGWPTLLVCAAANISDTAATPPGRAVTSFTFSCEAIGGPLVGGVATRDYEDCFDDSRTRYLTLPSAVAMSGAALSPSMGKMTRRPLTFLMALANVRLGVWVPNPQRLESWRRPRALVRRALYRMTFRQLDLVPTGATARPRPHHLVNEMLGRNSVGGTHLYVTDGGHYENLGLVELLRRGCTDVYCFDASGGASFENLGDAIALARTELNVEIRIDPLPLVVEGDRRLARCDCVRGTVKFPPSPGHPEGATGTLVYARTVMTAAAPWDVHAYHEADETFPHDPTVDQLYTDQKFEAYRALGELAGTNACGRMEMAASLGEAAPLPPLPGAPSSNGRGPAPDAAAAGASASLAGVPLAARLTAQLLAGDPARDPVAVAERLLALQAQDPRGARLAVRARTLGSGTTAADVDRALTDERSLVISWLNRGTLQLVRREDWPWLHALTTPPLRTGSARRLAQEGVPPADAERGAAAVERALADEGPLTREQLRERVAAAGVRVEGQAHVHVLLAATLRHAIVRGPMRGTRHAFALARDWLGEEATKPVDRDRALAELARRYLAGHGPASDRDLARWAGLPLRDARAGLGAIAPLLVQRPDGLVDLAQRPAGEDPGPLPPPRLLGVYDPLLLGWCSRADVLGERGAGIVTTNGLFRPFLLVRGRAAGLWRLERGEVVLDPFGRLASRDAAALKRDAADVRRFLGT